MNLKLAILILFFVKQILTELCYTPEKEEGECIPLHNCSKLFEAFANPIRGSETYLQKFVCNKEKEIKVCCGLEKEFSVLAEQHSNNPLSQILWKDAFPEYKVNSLSDITLPVIVTTNVASNEEVLKCVGAFFNPRYVLTSAGCVTSNRDNFSVEGVRFHVRGNDFFVGVEEVIPHHFYDKVSGINDLGLLRLKETLSDGAVTFLSVESSWTIYLHPITFVGLDVSKVNERLNKTTVDVDFLFREKCETVLKSKNASVIVTTYDQCATIEKGEIACNGYAGLPLAYSWGGEVFFKGISSTRARCGDGLPDVYTTMLFYIPWLMNNMKPWTNNEDQCMTPDGIEGHCVSVFYCLSLLEMFVAARNTTEDYLRKFICKEQESTVREFFVCCPPSSNVTFISNKNLENTDVPKIFLEKYRCGMQHYDDYFSSSMGITIDEYPWIARIESQPDICNGALINARYIIVTATCMITLGSELHDITVRLGDFNRFNATDCVEDPDTHESDCTQTEQYSIEDKIIHPFYIRSGHTNFNDICLLRLNKTVLYTDYIRPVCLHVGESSTLKVGDVLYRSGWLDFALYEEAEVKTKIQTKLITSDECHRNIKRFGEFINIDTICTLDLNITDTSGETDKRGLLMTHRNYQWYIEGLSDRQYDDSGDITVKYVNVSQYLNWILETMRLWK